MWRALKAELRLHGVAPDECGSTNPWHPADDSFDRTLTKAFRRIRNKLTSAVFRPRSSWGCLNHGVAQTLLKSDYLSRRVALNYFVYFAFNHRASEEASERTLKCFLFPFCCCWQLIDVESVQEEWRSSLIYWAETLLPSSAGWKQTQTRFFKKKIGLTLGWMFHVF